MKRGIILLFSLLLAVSIGFVADDSPAAGPKGAKALFYSGEGTTISNVTSARPTTETRAAAPTKVKYMGISYWIEKMGKDGEMRRVTTSTVFRRGDRIKVSLKSNREGYLYVINVGSSGASNLLFPGPNTPQGANQIQAGQVYDIPPNSFFRFDENPGEELLIVMLSPNPIDGGAPAAPPVTTASSQGTNLPPPPPPSSDPNLPPPPPSGDMTGAPPPPPPSGDMYANASGGKGAKGAKDLYVEGLKNTAAKHSYGGKDMYVEEDRGASPAMYAVAPVSALQQGNQVISLKIKLKHR